MIRIALLFPARHLAVLKLLKNFMLSQICPNKYRGSFRGSNWEKKSNNRFLQKIKNLLKNDSHWRKIDSICFLWKIFCILFLYCIKETWKFYQGVKYRSSNREWLRIFRWNWEIKRNSLKSFIQLVK